MAVITAPYPYHKAVMVNRWLPHQRSLPAPKGTFQHLATEPVTNDKYLCDLVPVLEQYQRQVVNKTFTMVIPLKPPMQKIVYVAPQIMIELMSRIQAYAAAVSTQSQRARPSKTGDVSIQLVLMNTEVIAHHSSILIHMIKRLLEKSESTAASPSPKNLSRLRELKEGLVGFNIFLEKVIAHYTLLPTISQPPIENIRQAMTRVKNVLRIMKSEKIHKLLAPYNPSNTVENFIPFLDSLADESEDTVLPQQVPHHFDTTQDDILCSILGLSEEMRHQLNEIDEEERAHETDKYLIKQMLEGIYEILLDESSENVESRFISCVFKEAKVEIFSGLLDAFPTKYQQSVIYWSQRFIENEFEYDILLNDNARPFDPDSGDMTVDSTCRVIDVTGESETIQVPTTYAQCMDDINSFITRISDGKHVVFFHGTDAVSAKRIIENGIMLGKGNRQQDFSDGYGFYVTENGQTALKWAKHGNFAPSAAVVAFEVPNNTLEEFTKLDLTDDMEMWKNIINYNRCGKDRRRFKIPAELKKTLGKADFVVGKECTLETTADWPEKELTQGNDTQACILTDRMADAVGDVRNISVCFFEKKF